MASSGESHDRIIGEMQAQIETLGSRCARLESEIDRRTESTRQWIEKIEGIANETRSTVLTLGATVSSLGSSVSALDKSISSAKKSAMKVVWATVTPVLTAIGLAIWNLIKSA